MADYTMCANKECKDRMKCYRYRAVPSPVGMQSMFAGESTKKEEERCASFLPAERWTNLVPERELE